MIQSVEFTREDLEYIMHLWHVCNSYHSSPSQNFKNKIQSMIDNYNEQESVCHRCGHGVTTNE